MEQEEWKWIVGQEGRYQVSNHGNILSLVGPQPKLLKPYRMKNGYVNITLSDIRRETKRIKILVHRAVASAFIPNPNNLPDVNHKDSNPANNSLSNLEWVTKKQNSQHAVRFGYLKPPVIRGEDAQRSKLTEAQVREIRSIYKPYTRDYNQTQLARKYGVAQSTIGKIISGIDWAHIV